MKRIIILIFVLVILILIFFILGKYFINGMKLQGNATSDSIQDSKKIGVYVGMYRIDSIGEELSDTLRKYKINLAATEIWIESAWHTKSRYIVFHPVQTENYYQLLYNNITFKKCPSCKKELRFSLGKIKSDEYFNYSVPQGEAYRIDSIPVQLIWKCICFLVIQQNIWEK